MAIISYAQPADKTVIVVGDLAGTALAEDQVLIDSVSNWVENVIYYGSAAFNAASADTLYTDIDGVIISESINSVHVGNFGLRDEYPVPCILMEGTMTGDPETETTKWPLLMEGGGIWGYGTPEDEDIQWRIVNNEHHITKEYDVDDLIYYGETAGRGVPYIHDIDPEHIILATAARSDGGDVEDFVQDDAIAVAYIIDPEILYLNVAYTYLAEGTPEFYGILKRGAQFLFDFVPVGMRTVFANETNLSIFPNPATSIANIRFSIETGRDVSVNLISVTGGFVGNIYQGASQSGQNSINLNTDNYLPGLYFIELKMDNKLAYKKFVLK